MRAARFFVFILLAAFAVSLRARPFPMEEAVSHVSVGRSVLEGRNFLRPEGAADALVAAVDAQAGPRGLSLLSLGLFVLAFALALDAAAGLGGFGTASLLAVLLLPLGMGHSAPDPWLFSALFAAAFLQATVRARKRSWPAPALLLLPAITAAWPLFHDAGVLLGPFLALTVVLDGVLAWWAAEHAPQGGVFIAPQDPLLFREEELDLPSFLKVLGWETKMNQFLHQRLGLSAARLSTLTAGRAVEVLNSLLSIPDLPQQADVPDLGGANGDFRARNRKILEVQYRDALRLGAKAAVVESPHAPLPPLPLWAPVAAAVLSLAAIAVPPAGPQALGKVFGALSEARSLLWVPSDWWVSAPRSQYLAAPYFWMGLVVFLAAALVGLAKNRERFSAAFFAAGLALFAAVLPAPAAAPLAAVVAVIFAAAMLRGLWREETLVRTLASTAAIIFLLTLLFMADWDHFPLGAEDLGLGAVPPTQMAAR